MLISIFGCRRYTLDCPEDFDRRVLRDGQTGNALLRCCRHVNHNLFSWTLASVAIFVPFENACGFGVELDIPLFKDGAVVLGILNDFD